MADLHNKNLDPWKILGWIMDITVVAVIGYLVFLNAQITDLQNWKSSVQSVMFTQAQHNSYAVTVANEFRIVEKSLSDVRTEQLKESKIVSTQLAALGVQLQNIELTLKRLETNLDKTNEKLETSKTSRNN